jgi:muramoyltetrapeptide carboxypeptidase
MDRVRSLGFRVKTGANVGRRNQYLAGTDDERAADFNALIADPEVDALFCIRGGYGSARILPLIDYDAIITRPKIILGFSDITAILNAVQLRTGLVTFHGPVAGLNFTDYSLAEFRKVLMRPQAPVGIGAPPPFEVRPGIIDVENRITRIRGGRAEGRLVGGNLTLLAHLMGTPWEPDFSGAILVLEDVGESPYRIDRMLAHLWLAGRLQQTAGIVFGKFTETDHDGNSFSVERVLRDRCEPLGIPVLRGLMIGHVPDQTVVPIGARAALDADAGTLTLLEPAVA